LDADRAQLKRDFDAIVSFTQRMMGAAVFKTIILARLHVLLKPYGFRKNGSTFSSGTNDVVLFVQLQSSSKTTSATLVATVNLGVFSRTVANKVRNTRKPSILEAHWRERVGFLLDEPTDKWWQISSEQQAIAAAEELSEILLKSALPKFHTLSSSESLKRLWETGEAPGLTEFQRQQFLKVMS
jgi:hypothetical protein